MPPLTQTQRDSIDAARSRQAAKDAVPTLTEAQLQQLGVTFRAKLAGDTELKGFVTAASDPKVSNSKVTSTSSDINLTIDGRPFSSLSPAQRDRVKDKSAFHLVNVVSEFQPHAARERAMALRR